MSIREHSKQEYPAVGSYLVHVHSSPELDVLYFFIVD